MAEAPVPSQKKVGALSEIQSYIQNEALKRQLSYSCTTLWFPLIMFCGEGGKVNVDVQACKYECMCMYMHVKARGQTHNILQSYPICFLKDGLSQGPRAQQLR